MLECIIMTLYALLIVYVGRDVGVDTQDDAKDWIPPFSRSLHDVITSSCQEVMLRLFEIQYSAHICLSPGSS